MAATVYLCTLGSLADNRIRIVDRITVWMEADNWRVLFVQIRSMLLEKVCYLCKIPLLLSLAVGREWIKDAWDTAVQEQAWNSRGSQVFQWG